MVICSHIWRFGRLWSHSQEDGSVANALAKINQSRSPPKRPRTTFGTKEAAHALASGRIGTAVVLLVGMHPGHPARCVRRERRGPDQQANLRAVSLCVPRGRAVAPPPYVLVTKLLEYARRHPGVPAFRRARAREPHGGTVAG